jgi:hypothetical protein
MRTTPDGRAVRATHVHDVGPRLASCVSDLVAMFRDDGGALWFARAVVAACVLAVLLPRTRTTPPPARLERRTPRWRDRDGVPSPLATAALIVAFCAVSFLYACLYVRLW